MNKSFLLSLSLVAALAIPAVAQQNQTQQPQDQTTQAAPAQPAQAQPAQTAEVGATGKEPLKYERHEGFWGKMNPVCPQEICQPPVGPGSRSRERTG